MRRAVFVDRDGVICRNRKDHVRNWEQFVFLPGALTGLARLAKSDLCVVVITNQAIVNRQIVPAEVVEEINDRMVRAVASAGGRVDEVMYCPHRPDEHCACRKPRPGLLLQAAEKLDLDLGNSYLVGDAQSDIQAGQSVGCACYLVLTGRGKRQLIQSLLRGQRGFKIASDLRAATEDILRRQRGESGARIDVSTARDGR
ncbi:MAG: HAD-IIIA family hydrolase [Chloroflexi bacterium]|nr:HAD-IIIA family hydrolase [Chloroflexota bacterium]